MKSPSSEPITPEQARRNVCLVITVALFTTLLLSMVLVGVFLFLVIKSTPVALQRVEPDIGERVILPAPPPPAPTPSAPILSTETISTLMEIRRFEEGEVGPTTFAPDGLILAIAHGHEILLYDTFAEQVIQTLRGHGDTIQALAFSPTLEQGQPTILASSAVNEPGILIWDLRTGMATWRLEGHRGWVRSLAFSPNGSLLASTSTDRTIRLWDMSDGTLLLTLHGHTDMVNGVAFHPDGNHIASTSRDGSVRIWDLITGNQIWEWNMANFAHKGTGAISSSMAPNTPLWTTGVAFSPDGNRLAIGTTSATLLIMDWKEETIVHQLQGHTDWIGMHGVAFSPDGSMIASASLDGSIRLWNPESGAIHKTFRHGENQLVGVSWNPQGTMLATSSTMSGRVTIWDIEQGVVWQDIPLVQGNPRTLTYSHDGHILAVSGINGAIRLHLLTQQRQMMLAGGAGISQAIAFLPIPDSVSDATISGSSDGLAVATTDPAQPVVIVDLNTRKPIQTINLSNPMIPTDPISSEVVGIAASPDQQPLLAMADNNGTVMVWDITEQRPIQYIQSQAVMQVEGVGASAPRPITALTFCQDSLVVSTDAWSGESSTPMHTDPRIGIWDRQTGTLRRVLRGHNRTIVALASQPGGSLLASASDDGTVRLWDCTNGHDIAILVPKRETSEGNTISLTSVAFSPPSPRSLLAVGDTSGQITFWDAETLQPYGQFATGAGAIFSLAFRPDGKQLAVGSRGGVLFLEAKPITP